MRIPIIIAITASVAVSGCRFLEWHGLGTNDDHREEWASRSDGDYSFVMNRGCFCFPAGVFDVEVVDYAIVSMVNVNSGDSVSSDYFEYVHTIEQMFDLIEEAEKDADRFSVAYAREGYPSKISIDWIEQAADDEIWYSLSDVVIR